MRCQGCIQLSPHIAITAPAAKKASNELKTFSGPATQGYCLTPNVLFNVETHHFDLVKRAW